MVVRARLIVVTSMANVGVLLLLLLMLVLLLLVDGGGGAVVFSLAAV